LPEGIAEERSAPEFKTLPRSRFAANVAMFTAHAIHDGDVHAVSYRMCALNRPPGVVLCCSVLLFFRRMPADRRRIKQNVCPLQRGQTRAFGIPLVPANQRADFSKGGVKRAEAEVPGRKVELFVVEGIV